MGCHLGTFIPTFMLLPAGECSVLTVAIAIAMPSHSMEAMLAAVDEGNPSLLRAFLGPKSMQRHDSLVYWLPFGR